MSKRFTLGVITPNYNHGNYLEQTLNCVMGQDRPPDQYVIVDDGSTDQSLEILDRYRSHAQIEIIENGTNQGVFHSVRTAFDRIQTDYIYLLSADDYPLPGFFSKAMAFLEQHPEAGLCSALPLFEDLTNGQKSTRITGEIYSQKAVYLSGEKLAQDLGVRSLWIPGHATLVNVKALREAGGLMPELKWHCDWFALHTIAFRKGMCFIPEPLAVMRTHPRSFSADRKPEEQAQVLWKITELLKSPSFKDVKPYFEKSNLFQSFPEFEVEIYQSLAQTPEASPEAWLKLSALRRAQNERLTKIEDTLHRLRPLITLLLWIRAPFASLWKLLFHKPEARELKKHGHSQNTAHSN